MEDLRIDDMKDYPIKESNWNMWIFTKNSHVCIR